MQVSGAAGRAAGVLLRAAGVGKTIDERAILSGIDLEVPAGRFLALLGANGAGKTTLLKILATLIAPSCGKLELFGEAPGGGGRGGARARIGLIGHQSMLYHDLTARENLEFFGKLYGVKKPRARALELLEMLALADRAEDAVKSFSRGMTQRVAIARALMHDPDLLLADEPFAGLDAPSAHALEGILAKLHAGGKTIILANHDIYQTLRLVEHVVVLRGGKKALDRTAAGLEAGQVLQEMGAA